jgi:predicted nucleotidyltransferase
MKTLEEIKSSLETLKPTLRERFGVETIGLFGSYTRGEQTKKSDIDILVTFSKGAQIGFFKFLELEEFLTKKFGVKVDLVTKNALKPFIKERVLRETVYALKGLSSLYSGYFGINQKNQSIFGRINVSAIFKRYQNN